MAAGRPHNSTTPAWRSTPAIKVRAYRFLMGDKATKADCAKETGLSRTTVIKWWDQVEWTSENSQIFDDIQNWMGLTIHHTRHTPKQCAEDLGISLDIAKFELATLDEIFSLGAKWNQHNDNKKL